MLLDQGQWRGTDDGAADQARALLLLFNLLLVLRFRVPHWGVSGVLVGKFVRFCLSVFKTRRLNVFLELDWCLCMRFRQNVALSSSLSADSSFEGLVTFLG